MKTPNRYTQEVRERAVRMVQDHEREYDSQWAAIKSIAEKIGCTSETLRKWVRQAERDSGKRPGLATEERERLKVLKKVAAFARFARSGERGTEAAPATSERLRTARRHTAEERVGEQ